MSGVVIGRDAELDAIDERLRNERLVTLVGPGGVGKTTVAVAAADRAAPRFPHGVRRVDLTRVETPDGARGAIAAQLGFDSFESLLAIPGDLPVLIVVDNCEHLLDAAASAIGDLLSACEQPTVVATSRSPLELPGEAVVALAPLPVPAPDDPRPEQCASVRLFLERAGAAGATIGDDLSVVSELCRRLDGLPLAIELAAVRARTLSVSEIADRLASGVEVLERRHFRGERRHRSIVDTIRWSYDLLDTAPAALLQRLSVFAGPFERDTAQAVAADESRPSFEDDLDELVYASLVSVDTSGPTTRYRLLDTVRRFSLDRLRESGGLGATMDRFVEVVLATAVATQEGGHLSWRASMIGDLLQMFEDVGEALRWCNEHDASPDRALRLCSLLWVVVHQGRAEDVVMLARQTVDRWGDRDHRLTPAAIATLATAEYVTGRHERAIELAEAVLDQIGETGSAAVTLRRVLGQARTAVGDLDEARELFAEGAAIARRQGLRALALELDVAHAQLRAATGDLDGAIDAMRDNCREAARSDSQVNDAWSRTALAWLLLRRDVAEADAVATAALGDAQRIRYPIAISANMRTLAYAALLREDLARAQQLLADLLDQLVRRGAFRVDGRLLLDAVASLSHRAGHPAAAQLAATAQTLPFASLVSVPGTSPVDVPPGGAEPLPHLQAVRAVRSVLDDLATGPAASRASSTPDGDTQPAMVAHGDVWEVSYDGTNAALRPSKGLADLARLLATPGAEMHCLDLAGAGAEERPMGAVLDTAARKQLEQRLRDLQDELDEADQHSDLARAERAQAEFDAVLEHLSSALGRGGRSRAVSGTAERARSAVTQRIRSAIRRAEEVHPALGRHLRASIVTGTWCAYRPERPTTWVIDV